MTMIDPGTAALRDLCGGAVALPGDDGYDAARQAFNLAVDQRPAAVAYPADASEVAEVVRAARAAGLRVAPQATGHNAGPLGDLSRTVLVKTSGMGGVEIDAERRIARVGAGVLWEDVVDAAAPHGLVALHGSSPNVGVAGYSLGGGMGWLARSHGLQANSVTAIELVTADGEFVRTDADNDPELFWALRGGGGNFGIVTALEFKLYPLTEIFAGFMIWDWTEAERVLTAWAQWAVDAPDHVTTSFRIMQLPPLEELPEIMRGRSLVMIDGAVQGDPAVIEPLRALEPELDTFAMVPAPALVRLHQDPEEPMPFVSRVGARRAPARRGDQRAARARRPRLRLAAGRASSCARCGGALRRATPGHGAVAGIDAEFVLFAAGVALDADMGAFMLAHASGVTRRARALARRRPVPQLRRGRRRHRRSATTTRRTPACARSRTAIDPDNVIHANHAI